MRRTPAISEESGQGLLEYVLVLLFISIATMAILISFGNEVDDLFQSVVDAFP